jgi:hypothetical protein
MVLPRLNVGSKRAKWLVTMKWLNRTAQGFSPGLSMRGPPESGGRGPGLYENGFMTGRSNQQMEITHRTLTANPFGRHFQGACWGPKNLAVVLCGGPSPGRDRVLVPRPRDRYRSQGHVAIADENITLIDSKSSRRAGTRALPDLRPATAGWLLWQSPGLTIRSDVKPWITACEYS